MAWDVDLDLDFDLGPRPLPALPHRVEVPPIGIGIPQQSIYNIDSLKAILGMHTLTMSTLLRMGYFKNPNSFSKRVSHLDTGHSCPAETL